jgi:FMN phosphatase YigB (HAD superfamily)
VPSVIPPSRDPRETARFSRTPTVSGSSCSDERPDAGLYKLRAPAADRPCSCLTPWPGPDWPAFPDSAAALARLKARFRLGVLTNCDDDLFAASNRRLGVAFDWIVTAQQVRSYKPDTRNFAALFGRLAADGVQPERILHVAQSLFHDHAPAKRLGLTTVWIDRRHGRPGFGATLPAEARPVATFTSMGDFAGVAVPLLGR